MIVRKLARPMLASVFITGGIDALRHPSRKVDAAQPGLDHLLAATPPAVGDRLPSDPEMLVRVHAAIQIGAGALLAAGKAPRIAALVLAGTLIPTTAATHDFWNADDPATRARQRTEFVKNVGLLGGLLLAGVDTEGKPSLGWRGRRAARHAQQAVAAALPLGSAASAATADTTVHQVAEHVKALADDAAERGTQLLDRARDHGPELAERARERGLGLVEAARDHVPELTEGARELTEGARERGGDLLALARDRAPELAEEVRRRGSSWWEATREAGADWAQRAQSVDLDGHLPDITKTPDRTDRAAARTEEAKARAEQALARAERKLAEQRARWGLT